MMQSSPEQRVGSDNRRLVVPGTGRAILAVAVRARQSGGTAVGFLVGTVFGLAIAVGVAIVVTRAPMPFVNKSETVNAKVVAPRNGRLPDPNLALRQQTDNPPLETDTADAADSAAAVKPGGASDPAGRRYLLQAGAYRSEVDAQSMRARLALIGYEAEIRAALVNNETLYRVRLGPFVALDQINSARANLANNGIEASVVRQ